ncbi:hypothetical protein [Fictibacillus terranigra]|uniref:hypothetical protein n=1 Tax=Fictibacillus terranigra TaxID=3058424 RepID=UPI00338E5E56
MSVVLVVVEHDENVKKYIPVIRKNTYLGSAEITKRIRKDKPIMECKLFHDTDDDVKLKQLIKELIDAGAKIKLFQDEIHQNNEITVDYLINRFNRYEEIQRINENADDFKDNEKQLIDQLRVVVNKLQKEAVHDNTEILQLITKRYKNALELLENQGDIKQIIILGSVQAYMDSYNDYQNSLLGEMHEAEKLLKELIRSVEE